jgi:hypothetical protein
MEQETSILRYTELTAILHSTSKKELTTKMAFSKNIFQEKMTSKQKKTKPNRQYFHWFVNLI